jgi:RES domain-containing protein
MTVWIWRIGIDTPGYAADDLSGEGARRSGGRWNRAGTPMVYVSQLDCASLPGDTGPFGIP